MTQNIEAQYISCLMHSPDLLEHTDIEPEQLEGTPRKIYEAMRRLFEAGEPIKTLTVSQESGVLDAEMSKIYKTDSSRELLTTYEDIIKSKFLSVKAKEIADELCTIKTCADYEAVLDKGRGYITNERIGVSDIRQMIKAHEINVKSKSNAGILNPFTSMSDYIRRFYAGQYVIVGGRPSKGKSAFMLSLLRRMSCPVGIVSLETTEAEIMARLIAQQAHISLDIVSNGSGMAEEQLHALIELDQKNIYCYDKSSSWRKIKMAMREMVRKQKCKIIGIDYVQLVNMGEGRDRTESLGELSRECKEFARRNDCTIIALAQLGRAADEGRPKLKDLQWSSQLEQDADVVMLIHEQDGRNTIQIEKNRDGRTGEVEMKFEKFCVDWSDGQGARW